MTEGRPPISRRRFIRLALLAGIGASTYAVYRNTQPVGPANYLRWSLRGYGQQVAGRQAIVGLQECRSYADDLESCLYDLWRQAAMPDVAGKRVLVKPNLVDAIAGHPATTAPAMVGAVLDVLARLGASEVAVGDGPAFRREAWPVAQQSGLAEVLARRNVRFVDLNYDDPRPVPAKDGWFLHAQEIWLPRHVREADLIVSVPKLKTHHWAGVSLSLKNLLGVVPGMRYGWPKNMLHVNGLPLSILGIYQSLRPVVAIVDGIVGMEGDGPLFGTPVEHGLVAMSRDPVAVDLTCAELMGMRAQRTDHLLLAKWAGLGQGGTIETRGVPTERLQKQYQEPPSLY